VTSVTGPERALVTMPRHMRLNNRLRALLAGLAALTALFVAGCGGDDGGGSSGDLAGYAPQNSPVYIEGTIRPEGELRDNLESLVSDVAGIDDPGQRIIDEINSELGSEDGSGMSYEDDIEPWLGDEAAIFLGDFSGDDESSGVIVATTDSDEAQKFIDKISDLAGDSLQKAEYDGSDYLTSDGGESFGIVDNAVVFGGSEETFKAVADASGGDSLEDADDFSTLFDEAPDGSLANVFVNTENFLTEVRSRLEPESRAFFDTLGQQGDPGSALVSLVPGSSSVELQALSTAESPMAGASPDLLEELPADAFAALVAPDVGEQLTAAIDSIDSNGIPGEVPPGQLKGALQRFGINLVEVTQSLGDVGVYVKGTSRQDIGGAVVIQTDNAQRIAQTLDRVEKLLRQRQVEGYQSLPGGAGFSIRDPNELGPQPLVFLAQGDRFVIGYGEDSAREAVAGGGGQTLAGNPAYQEAADALEGVEPTGFIDFQALLTLVENVRPDVTSEDDYQSAAPFLQKLAYLAFGTGTEGDLTTARFILGLTE
jgi:uncharacterized protein DUF3352